MFSNTLKTITQILLISVIAITPFVKVSSLYFPFISGKVYLFRALVALAFFFWAWLIIKAKSEKRELRHTNTREQQTNSARTGTEFKNVLVIALVLFFLAQVVVSFFGVDPFYSFFSSIDRGDGVFQYGFWLLYFLMVLSVFKDERDWKKLSSVFIVAAIILSVYSFFSSDPNQPKFSGLFGNPAYFGAFLLFAIGFCLILYVKKFFYPNQIHKFLPAVAAFFTAPLILTQIRGAYAGLAGGVFLFCLLSFLFLRRENRKLANWCAVILVAGTVFTVAIFAQRETAFVRNSKILSRVTVVADFWQVPSVRERLLNWNIALKAFQDKPIFGWGPENYGAAANKYYDLRIGENEPWFDRAHSQPFDILATGGITLFVFYVFWVLAVFLLIYRVSKEKKILSFILASTFSAYLIQGFFLFDILAVYLGLFPFLAYLVYLNSKPETPNFKQTQNSKLKIQNFILVGVAVFSVSIIYTTVITPWQANNAGWHFFNLSEQGLYKETKPYLEKAFSFNSPYTSWELRKMTAWKFMEILESDVSEDIEPAKLKEIQDLYDFLVPEFEKTVEAQPTNPQMYHVLAEIYRLGFEKLGKNDLDNAEKLLEKAFNYSNLRAEYFNDFAKIALLQGKFEQAERVIKEHTERMPPEWGEHRPFVTLGNFYFEAEKYEQALEQYDKARAVNFRIQQNEAVYPRYMLAAEKVGDYQRIVEMAQKYLEIKGPDADTYFNIAVGYFNLGDKEKAKEFFLKAVELKPEYEQYKTFFE